MHQSYEDITGKLGQPTWWDERGVPRYCEFSPRHCSNIYADQVVLLRIECQGCGQPFDVCLSQSKMERYGYIPTGEKGRAAFGQWPSLEDLVREERIHYGDPPNIGCCPAGPTMNSIPRRVLQFWKQDRGEPHRDPSLEIDLLDEDSD